MACKHLSADVIGFAGGIYRCATRHLVNGDFQEAGCDLRLQDVGDIVDLVRAELATEWELYMHRASFSMEWAKRVQCSEELVRLLHCQAS